MQCGYKQQAEMCFFVFVILIKLFVANTSFLWVFFVILNIRIFKQISILSLSTNQGFNLDYAKHMGSYLNQVLSF